MRRGKTGFLSNYVKGFFWSQKKKWDVMWPWKELSGFKYIFLLWYKLQIEKIPQCLIMNSDIYLLLCQSKTVLSQISLNIHHFSWIFRKI
jgi:hypothetical protein